MRVTSATLPRPSAGDRVDVDAARLHAHLMVLPKKEAVSLLMAVAGVTRSWAERHLHRLHSLSPSQMAVVLTRQTSTAWIRKFRNLDPTGELAARNVDRERALAAKGVAA
ncbi:hypothetical protein ACSBQY_10425 [Micrococcus lylae]|uniref:hypothetical protein n=1 Tax=Micrococcus lylae TaxID=1273 RepID=UPI003EB6B29B